MQSELYAVSNFYSFSVSEEIRTYLISLVESMARHNHMEGILAHGRSWELQVAMCRLLQEQSIPQIRHL